MLRLLVVASLLIPGLARADRSVDWSEYLETPADKKPLVIKHDEVAVDKEDAKPTKANKVKAKKVAKQKKTARASKKKTHKSRHH